MKDMIKKLDDKFEELDKLVIDALIFVITSILNKNASVEAIVLANGSVLIEVNDKEENWIDLEDINSYPQLIEFLEKYNDPFKLTGSGIRVAKKGFKNKHFPDTIFI